jgi:hypothetical protein
MTLAEAFGTLDGVQHELSAALYSVTTAQREVRADPTKLKDWQLRPSHLWACADHLEPTYLLRLFAEFEGVLRGFLAVIRPSPRPRRTRMEVLMDRIGAARQVSAEVLIRAHEVREHRNALVHRREGETPPHFTFAECKSRLSFYLSYLPRQW